MLAVVCRSFSLDVPRDLTHLVSQSFGYGRIVRTKFNRWTRLLNPYLHLSLNQTLGVN
jgi:hypothetical protein